MIADPEVNFLSASVGAEVSPKTKTCGIYTISSPSGKVYVGQSTNIEARFRAHMSALRREKHPNGRLQGACAKYGLEALKFSIAEICAKDKLNIREQWFIDNFNSQYNMSRSAFSNMLDPLVVSKLRKTKKSRAALAAEKMREVWTRPEYRIAWGATNAAFWSGSSSDYAKKTIGAKTKVRWGIAAERAKFLKRLRNGPTKREIEFSLRARLGSIELSQKLSEGLRQRHSESRYNKLLQAGLLLLSTEGLRQILNEERRLVYPSNRLSEKGRIAQSILRNS